MKYVIIHGDGMADWPCEELGGKTPLAAAHKPNMDLMATRGTLGMVATIPKGMPPGSDVGTMTMLGYDPARYHTGRAPIEAASQGIEMGPRDVVFRMNLVSLKPGDGGAMIMNDFTSGHITSEEAAQIVADLRKELAGGGIEFFNGVSYRHLMMWRGGIATTHLTPPHDITGKPVEAYLPKGAGADLLRDLMRRSAEILREHPVNKARRAAGKTEATSVVVLGAGHAARGADAEGTLRRRGLGDIGGRSGQRARPAGRTEPDQGSGRDRISRYRLRREGALRTRIAQSRATSCCCISRRPTRPVTWAAPI